MLSSKVRIVQKTEDEPEDIFSYSLGLIFTDDTRNMHGDPDALVVYNSEWFGDIEMTVVDPRTEEDRKLFSHYLWNAGLQMAEFIAAESGKKQERGCKNVWDLEGETVVELGAGVGLAGIIATLAGAKEACLIPVAMTDYPAPEIMSNLKANVEKNIPNLQRSGVRIDGHAWGELDNEFALTNKNHFSRVVTADTLWMPWQHQNLARSILHFLSLDDGARALMTAGFHTGRAKLAHFFVETVPEEGLAVVDIYELHADGTRREWMPEGDGGAENVTERKKWLVVAVLRRR